MAGEVAEVVEDSVDMMARLLGGAARLGGTQGESGAVEGGEGGPRSDCSDYHVENDVGAISHTLNGRGAPLL